MIKIKTKALSVNKCWQGHRYKTNEYKNYEEEMLLRLPKIKIEGDKLKVKLVFGFSNRKSDIDNPIKPLLDILQKKYLFDDKNIYKLEIEKKIVVEGEEYLSFEIKKYAGKN